MGKKTSKQKKKEEGGQESSATGSLQVSFAPEDSRGDPDYRRSGAGQEEVPHSRAGEYRASVLTGVNGLALLAEEACQLGDLVLRDILDIAIPHLRGSEALVLLHDMVDLPSRHVP